MDPTADFLWIRFCPPAGGEAEVLTARREEGRVAVATTEKVPVNPPEDFELAVGRILKRALDAGAGRCVVDLDHCPWLNSQGIGVMIAWYQLVGRGGGRMVLARPNERVRNVLAVTRLEQVFTIHDDFDAAVDAVLAPS